MINCVLSFGAATGGLQLAEALKKSITTRTGWEDSSIYLDRDALEGKDGTESKTISTDEGERTANLNPSWATYYQVPIPQSPCNTHRSAARPAAAPKSPYPASATSLKGNAGVPPHLPRRLV